MPGMEAAKWTRQDEEGFSSKEGITLKDMEELLDDEVIPGAEQWCRLQQVSERAREKDGRASEEEVGEKMDGELWGGLQDHIPLHLVWETLPYQELSRLRVVCKAWNRSALQRLEAKPYFVTIALGLPPWANEPVYLNGLVRYDVASKEFSFKRHDLLERGSDGALDRVPPFAVEGLVFCYQGKRRGVYNLHTRAWHEVPEPPEFTLSEPSVWGMMVDTSERPYSFRLVMGCTVRKTQIYDSKSRSWSKTSSVLMDEANETLYFLRSYSCMCYDDCIYMCLNAEYAGQEMILVYSMNEDRWSELAFPPMLREPDRNTLGVWDGRIFAVREHSWVGEGCRVSVWELVDAKKQEWAEYASSSEDLYNELVTVDGQIDALHYDSMELLSFFCDEYLLVCNWRVDLNRSDTLVMFNLRTKKWELLAVPMGTVSLEDQREEFMISDEADLEEDVDVEGDFDELDEVDVVDEFDEVDDFDNYEPGDVDDFDNYGYW